MDRFKFLAKSRVGNLPKSSGVYAFKNDKNLMYIGKAANISDRVRGHFNQPSYRDKLFVEKVSKIGYFETGSEIEALILEANLIKKYQPKFNVVWRDDKNYFYVAIAKNEKGVPYVFVTHQTKRFQISNFKFQILYIGPFVEGTALKKTLRFLRKPFPYYTARNHPKIKCAWCHLGLCPGPEPDLKEYKKNIRELILVLKGKRGAVLGSLRKEMLKLSKENKFEEASKIRDRIFNLRQIMAHGHVINAQMPKAQDSTEILARIIGKEKPIYRIEAYDVSNIQGKFATGSMVVFIGGKPDKNQYRKFKIRKENKPNDIAMLKEVISRRLKHKEWQYPDAILIDGGKAQLNVAIACKAQCPKIKVMALAKGRQELFIEGRAKPIPLKTLPQKVSNLILSLDDEAHRFAIAYHKNLRKKSLLG